MMGKFFGSILEGIISSILGSSLSKACSTKPVSQLIANAQLLASMRHAGLSASYVAISKDSQTVSESALILVCNSNMAS